VNVLLFDVDGTLVSSGGAGARALERALQEVAHLEGSLAGVRFDGATDLWLVRQALAARGVPHSHELALRVLDRYVELLPQEIAASTGYRLLPGVTELLAALRARGAPLGLCTGNVARGARAKLARGGIDAHFAFGGFGNDAEARADILAVALRRAAEALGEAVDAARAWVVGDTPRDVEAALARGVRSLAVASGRFGVDELKAAGATAAVSTLATPGLAETLLA
jgi:phosphoglycolate phosphatase